MDGKDMLEQFFSELEPRLDMARKLERRLDRAAWRFNVLNYLDAKENGLSRTMGDLLDPKGLHGQGPLFLEALLEQSGMSPGKLGLNPEQARVCRERRIGGGRPIDICIEIPSNDRASFCLAVKNKPRAEDRQTRVSDCLEYLDHECGKNRFRLIYLSPGGEPPPEHSLPRAELLDGRWRDRLTVMSYADPHNAEDAFNRFREYRAPCSFADWVAACHERCRVDVLRRFLEDIGSYCKKEFKDRPMHNELKTKTVLDFLLEDAGRLEIARRVSDSWPQVRDRVCGKFLDHLRVRIGQELNDSGLVNEFGAVHVEPVRQNTQAVGIRLSQPGWNPPGCRYPGIFIRLDYDSGRHRPYGDWFFSVWVPGWDPVNNENDPLRIDLANQLNVGRHQSAAPRSENPWWQYAGENTDWNRLVPELHRESQDQRGGIADYFTEEFARLSRAAIPIINNLNA